MVGGARPEDVAAALGLARATAYGWLASYRKGGRQALLSRSVPGRPPAISPAQMRRLWTLIADADPRELQFSSALWTGDLIQELIRREFGICLSAATVRRLLLKMGLPARRPLPRTDQPDQVLGCRQASQFPAIRARAEADGAMIYLGDVQRVRPDASRQPDVVTEDPCPRPPCPRCPRPPCPRRRPPP
jgi:transposase